MKEEGDNLIGKYATISVKKGSITYQIDGIVTFSFTWSCFSKLTESR